MTEEELKAIEEAKALQEAIRVSITAKTSDQLIELISSHRYELSVAVEVLKTRVAPVL